mmetsp:Transcript_18408/g.31487  ORF Transcript_18408/g.31487 Transcript_18408/m.31487 type:complete len:98 (-) Transcript_18408:20-313(-)
MDVVDFTKRWVYKGSFTQPPCDQQIIWNVIEQVYPITQKDFFLIQQKFQLREADMGGRFNNRALNPIVNHNILFIGARKLFAASTIAISVFTILMLA